MLTTGGSGTGSVSWPTEDIIHDFTYLKLRQPGDNSPGPFAFTGIFAAS
jgi:hypothetical protein